MNQETETPAVPKGFRADSSGNWVFEKNIKPIDLLRDEQVRGIAESAKRLSKELAEWKRKTFDDLAAFVELSAEKYNAFIGGRDGNLKLSSFDGRYIVQRSIQKHIRFDERLLAAKVLIDECITDWSQGANQNLSVLIHDAFQVDKQGNINTQRVLSLRRIQIDDPRWLDAMQAISDAVQVTGSKTYVRVYERGANGEYKQVLMDVASQ